jgi:hypothetical protein
MNGGVVPVECGGVESRRRISPEERADVWETDMAWTSFGTDEAGVTAGSFG